MMGYRGMYGSEEIMERKAAAYDFWHDGRLGIDRPRLHVPYEQLSEKEQHLFELRCQEICSRIPPQIKSFEREYMNCFEALNQSCDDQEFEQLFNRMNDLSSRICDLNVLYLHIEGSYLEANVHG
jgi:microcystin degradation protein MlrC